MPEGMDASYSIWLETAAKVEAQLRSLGSNPIRLLIDLDDFELWCRSNQKPVNASSRSECASRRGEA